jgi:hypothetical protein
MSHRHDFPRELLEASFLDVLIRESPEDFITKERIAEAQRQDTLRPFFQAGSGGRVSVLSSTVGFRL